MFHEFVNIPNFNKLVNEVKIKGIDHIAYRSLTKPFVPRHCVKQPQEFYFPKMNVRAEWYKTHFDYKRVFTSCFLMEHCDLQWKDDLNYLIRNRMNLVDVKYLMSYKQYKQIYDYSQYVAWTLVHMNKINHVAVEVPDITVCEELRQKDFTFHENNRSIYNVSKDGKIIQASLVAEPVQVEFSDGTYEVPGSFIEIVERHREGFEMENAQNIFDSTKIQKL